MHWKFFSFWFPFFDFFNEILNKNNIGNGGSDVIIETNIRLSSSSFFVNFFFLFLIFLRNINHKILWNPCAWFIIISPFIFHQSTSCAYWDKMNIFGPVKLLASQMSNKWKWISVWYRRINISWFKYQLFLRF